MTTRYCERKIEEVLADIDVWLGPKESGGLGDLVQGIWVDNVPSKFVSGPGGRHRAAVLQGAPGLDGRCLPMPPQVPTAAHTHPRKSAAGRPPGQVRRLLRQGRGLHPRRLRQDGRPKREHPPWGAAAPSAAGGTCPPPRAFPPTPGTPSPPSPPLQPGAGVSDCKFLINNKIDFVNNL